MSNITFTEWCDSGNGQSWKVSKILEALETPYQKVELFETPSEGKLLVHDGAVMLTERFEANYHEMLVHPAMLTHPDPRNVLIIGGGDGGTLRETVKHDGIDIARQYEIDEDVVEISKRHLPSIASAYDHPLADAIIGDGIKALKEADEGSYDVILIDSTDPVGPAVQLFEKPFYENVFRALSNNGIMATQVGDYAYNLDHIAEVKERLESIFPLVRPYWGAIPMYPSGMWSFLLASKGPDPLSELDESRSRTIEHDAKIWNRNLHKASFAFPTYVNKRLGL